MKTLLWIGLFVALIVGIFVLAQALPGHQPISSITH